MKNQIFRNRYRIYLVIEMLVMVIVLAVFQLIQDRQAASVLASVAFLVSTLYILISERMKRRLGWTFGASFVFLIFSVLPILSLRLLNWNQPFAILKLFGLSGAWWHQVSNYLFMLLLMAIFIDSYLEQKKLNEASSK